MLHFKIHNVGRDYKYEITLTAVLLIINY